MSRPVLFLAVVLGCGGRAGSDERSDGGIAAPIVSAAEARAMPSASLGAVAAAPGASVPSAFQRDAKACVARIAAIVREPAIPAFELPPAERAALLAQVKATPVVFVGEPRAPAGDEVALLWRKELRASETPGKTLARL
ncbi:MAG TPA: hypothetical protein VFZ53_01270, partial [Polyangiaceae bacterium]